MLPMLRRRDPPEAHRLSAYDEESQPVPDLQGVVDGPAELPLGQDLRVLAQGEQFALEDIEDGGGLLPADRGAFVRRAVPLAQRGFDPVKFADDGDGPGGEALADVQRLVELAAGVRPAVGQVDAVHAGRPRGVAGVSVGLEVSTVVSKQVVEAGGLAAGVPLVEDVALKAGARRVDDPEVAGGGLAFAGVEVFDGRFVGLEVAAIEQAAVDELVKRLDGFGHDLVPVAEFVARKVDAVAAQHDALGAVMRPVVAVFGGGDVGDKPGRGTETQGGRSGGLERDGVGVVPGDMDDAHGAADEDAAGLVVEAVGDEALDDVLEIA